jgi:hypothetical protein
MSHGLHTNLSSHHVEKALVPRCQRLWWTIHVLDRQMTYLMGLPQSIRDDDVTAPLPEFEGDAFRTAAFAMRTKLSHFIATIDSGESLHSLFLHSSLPSYLLLTCHSDIRARRTTQQQLSASHQGHAGEHGRSSGRAASTVPAGSEQQEGRPVAVVSTHSPTLSPGQQHLFPAATGRANIHL